MTDWFDVATEKEFPVGERKLLQINGTPVAVFNLEGEYFAFVDCCTHQYLPLGDGKVTGKKIVCPFHGAVFDITSGEALCAPAQDDLTMLEVKLENGWVKVQCP